MHEFEEDSNENDDSEEENEDSEKPDKIMSMFASYYGMEDENKESDIDENPQSAADMIDSTNFNATVYVKELLMEKTGPELIVEDTKMIHEIRSLDSDMQMLVYENYNKFISATETIKRMKNNVEAMEQDMSAVRVKTNLLSENSIKLESTFHDKRAQVDKLVKVRKLLLKLEFLSELPEKLSFMIEHEKYKQAVELYNQTISVLTKHSNVLSFRNIQARTELMMKDLRVKVLELLDTSKEVDGAKLTHYVTTLRLMEAPKLQVMDKFFTAHRNRWLSVISKYESDVLGLKLSNITAGNYATSIANCKTPTITQLRSFHQSIVSGLMEACKGVYEMYVTYPNTTPTAEDTAAAIQSHAKLQLLIKSILKAYFHCIIISYQKFFLDYNEFVSTNKHIEYIHFQLSNKLMRLEDVWPSTGSGNSASANPFETVVETPHPAVGSMQERIQQYQANTDTWNESRNRYLLLLSQMLVEVQGLDDQVEEVRCFPHVLEAERVDGSSGEDMVVVINKYEHSDCYSKLLLEIIVDEQNAVCCQQRVELFLHVFANSIPRFIELCHVRSECTSTYPNMLTSDIISVLQLAISDSTVTVKDPVRNTSSSSNLRSLIPNRSQTANQWLQSLADSFTHNYLQLVTQLKGLYDVIAVLKNHTRDTAVSATSIATTIKQYDDTSSSIWQYMSIYPNSVSSATYETYFVHSIHHPNKPTPAWFGQSLRQSEYLAVEFGQMVSIRMEYACGFTSRLDELTVNPKSRGQWDVEVFSELTANHEVVNYPIHTDASASNPEEEDEIAYYEQINQKNQQKELLMKRNMNNTNSVDGIQVSFQDFVKVSEDSKLSACVAYLLLRKLTNNSFDIQVKDHMESLNYSMNNRVWTRNMNQMLDDWLATSQRLLGSYMEKCMLTITNTISNYDMMNCTMKCLEDMNSSIGNMEYVSYLDLYQRGDYVISNTMLYTIYELDMLSITSCILLNDIPPVFKSFNAADNIRSTNNNTNNGRRSFSNASAHRVGSSNVNANKHNSVGLQLDIERLFAEKIVIGNIEAMITTPSNHVFMHTLTKVWLKGIQEYIATLYFTMNDAVTALPHSDYIAYQLHLDLLCFKHMNQYLIKETTEQDRLFDLNTTLIMARCITQGKDEDEDQRLIQLLENIPQQVDVNRLMNDAIFKLNKKCVLFQR